MNHVTVWNRRFQPAALALSVAGYILGVTWLFSDRFTGFAHWATVAAALSVSSLLLGAWIAKSKRGIDYGYLFSVGVWIFTGWAAFVSNLSVTSVLLTGAWALLAGGSYVLEVLDGDGRWLP